MMDTTDLIAPSPSEIEQYDPQRELKILDGLKALEQHWARLQDFGQLYATVEEIVTRERKFILWFDAQGLHGGDRRSQNFQDGRTANLKPGQNGIPNVDQLKRMRAKLKTEEAFAITLEAAQHRCRRVCQLVPVGTVSGTEGTGEIERYTPAEHIELARRVLGGIELDVASCEEAQQTVQAERYFTIEDDGLKQDWTAETLFMNPPYHRDLCPAFIDKLIAEFQAGKIKRAIVLTNASVDTAWWWRASAICTAVCFPNSAAPNELLGGRIQFLTPGGNSVSPTRPQAYWLFGDGLAGFRKTFGAIGTIWEPSR